MVIADSDQFLGGMLCGVFAVILTRFIVFGKSLSVNDAADEAISDKPAKWWREALIDAEARKRKRELEEK